MQKSFLLLGLISLLFLTSCGSECEQSNTYSLYNPVHISFSELRKSVVSESPREVTQPGKIYVYGDYLLVNEWLEGIHIFDNSNPASPQKIGFVQVPGNIDMAIKNDILYADSYIDLVALDISNPANVVEVARIEDALPNPVVREMLQSAANVNFNFTQEAGVVTHFVEEEIVESADCDANVWQARPGIWLEDTRALSSFAADGANLSFAPPSGNTETGTGGSMARFTLNSEYLYAVNDHAMRLFNITNEREPQRDQEIWIGWGIETIFPYGDLLFIGAQNGMHIFDNSNPANPQQLSTYQHVNACDPVVVKDDLAYVTLRSGNECQGFANQLDVVDISDLSNPSLLKTYPMDNPHGLGIDGNNLFLCEGSFGLKQFDISDPLTIDQNQLEHFKEPHAFDVIPYNEVLILTGEDGIFQYSYESGGLELLSTLFIN